jgi:photosystem II stability/assembly factor-like uncharacterized protein
MRSVLLFLFSVIAAFGQASKVLPSHTTENLRGLSVARNHAIWASGTHGTYLRSTDDGKSWQVAQVPGAEALDFRDVEAISADEAYLLSIGQGEQSRIYKTVNGGKSWELQFTNKNPKGFFDCMAFWDRDRGIAIGDPVDGRFELIQTEDGGKSWSTVSPRNLPAAVEGEGAFAASGTCIVVYGKTDVWFATGGTVARVFHSLDAGKSWTVVETPIVHGDASSGIFSIAFQDELHGVMAGGDYKQPTKGGSNLAFTSDGGRTWRLAPISPQWYFSAISLLKNPAAGNSGGRKSAIIAVGTAQAGYANPISDKFWHTTWDQNLNAVSFYATGKAIGVGPKGLVVQFGLPK